MLRDGSTAGSSAPPGLGAGLWGRGLLGCGSVDATLAGGQQCRSPSVLLARHPGVLDPIEVCALGQLSEQGGPSGAFLASATGVTRMLHTQSCCSSWFLLGSGSKDTGRTESQQPSSPFASPL